MVEDGQILSFWKFIKIQVFPLYIDASFYFDNQVDFIVKQEP